MVQTLLGLVALAVLVGAAFAGFVSGGLLILLASPRLRRATIQFLQVWDEAEQRLPARPIPPLPSRRSVAPPFVPTVRSPSEEARRPAPPLPRVPAPAYAPPRAPVHRAPSPPPPSARTSGSEPHVGRGASSGVGRVPIRGNTIPSAGGEPPQAVPGAPLPSWMTIEDEDVADQATEAQTVIFHDMVLDDATDPGWDLDEVPHPGRPETVREDRDPRLAVRRRSHYGEDTGPVGLVSTHDPAMLRDPQGRARRRPAPKKARHGDE